MVLFLFPRLKNEIMDCQIKSTFYISLHIFSALKLFSLFLRTKNRKSVGKMYFFPSLKQAVIYLFLCKTRPLKKKRKKKRAALKNLK